MSNALAIAAVTAVLKDLLNNGVIDHDLSTSVGSPVTVTALPPDRIKVGDQEAPQINLFLYHVAPNSGWRNAGLPSRDDRGGRLTNPPLALDLYYLLSTYGKKDFDGEILLGYAMQMLHETPVLPRDAIRKALGNGPPSNSQPVTSSLLPVGPLAAADLADQVEQIKVVPQALNTEEISKLWTAMQGRYRPTAAYHASVVLIENDKPTRQNLPVVKRNILAQPFRHPFIKEAAPPIAIKGQTLTIRGQNLKASNTKLDFGILPLVDPLIIDDLTIQVKLPDALLAGVNTVRVVQQTTFDSPGDPHSGFQSNTAAFVLTPTITIANTTSATVTVKFVPNVGKTQRVQLVLNELNAPATRPAHGYTFDAPKENGISSPTQTDTDTITFATDGVLKGDYMVRVRVDNAESLPDVDGDKNSPTFGQYLGTPKIKVS